jgi:hypothetical protein
MITSLEAAKLRNQAWIDRGDHGSQCAIDRQYLIGMVNRYEETLRSIAANTCCGSCREAAQVAASVLEKR